MSAHFQTNGRRLAVALALSVLLHALFIFLPGFSLPHMSSRSSVLTVRMELIPKQQERAGLTQALPKTAPVAQPVPNKIKPAKPQPATTPSATAQISVLKQVASSVAAASATAPAASAVAPAASAVAPAVLQADAQVIPSRDIDPNRSKSGIPALPLHAQLRFAVYLNESSFSIGDMFQELDIREGRYTLQAELEKAGLASWFNSTQLTQISRGALLANGDLAPESYVEEATDARGGHHRYDAAFDWNAKQLRFADGAATTMPPGTQDRLSLLYQLSQYSFHTEKMHLTLTGGNKLSNILVEVGLMEDISTSMGKLRTLRLHQLHEPGEPGLDVWLASDYHMLPVRLQETGADGKISMELVIKEIHVSDDQPVK